MKKYKKQGFIYLGWCMDHLIMFVHPNEKVVPLSDTTPMDNNHHSHNQQLTTIVPMSHCSLGEFLTMTLVEWPNAQ